MDFLQVFALTVWKKDEKGENNGWKTSRMEVKKNERKLEVQMCDMRKILGASRREITPNFLQRMPKKDKKSRCIERLS